MKEGVVVPVYKGKGKDPLIPNSYHGITMSSVIAETLEIVLLKCMSPILDEIGFPDMNQTAFQKGISAIFSTQEVLVNYILQGTSYACIYDIEKTVGSVEFPILLSHLLFVGHQWKNMTSYQIMVQLSNQSCEVPKKVQNVFSAPFSINRGVKRRALYYHPPSFSL